MSMQRINSELYELPKTYQQWIGKSCGKRSSVD